MVGVGDTPLPVQKTEEMWYAQVQSEQFSVNSAVLPFWCSSFLLRKARGSLMPFTNYWRTALTAQSEASAVSKVSHYGKGDRVTSPPPTLPWVSWNTFTITSL